MDTTSTNPKTELLLGAGLDVLHFESREWQETIAFWKDEIRFFVNLLKKTKSTDEARQAYGNLLKEQDKIHASLFDFLADDIIEHEKFLSRLEKSEKGISDGNYREKHRQLKARMEVFSNDFKAFKKMVFDYAKNN